MAVRLIISRRLLIVVKLVGDFLLSQKGFSRNHRISNWQQAKSITQTSPSRAKLNRTSSVQAQLQSYEQLSKPDASSVSTSNQPPVSFPKSKNLNLAPLIEKSLLLICNNQSRMPILSKSMELSTKNLAKFRIKGYKRQN